MNTYITYANSRQGSSHFSNEDRHFPARGLIWGAVFDGISSGGGGEMAAAAALNAMKSIVGSERNPDWDIPETGLAILRKAQSEIRTRRESSPQSMGIGTTAAIVCIDNADNMLYWFNIGDSAIIRCRKGKAPVKLTAEDSVIGRLLAEGKITSQEADRLPQIRSHELVRFLGMDTASGEIADFVSMGKERLAPDDCVLVCSDGLSGYVPAKQIQRVISSSAEPAEELIAMAADRYGSPDDATAVVIRPSCATGTSKVPPFLSFAIGLLLFAGGFVFSSFLTGMMKEKGLRPRPECQAPKELVPDSTLTRIEFNNNTHNDETDQ